MPEERVAASLKQEVFRRAGGCCEYCRSQERFALQAFSIEHIVPKRRTGETSLSNLALACQGCNNHKYTKTEHRDPVTGRTAALYHPRKHLWTDHFAWNEDFSLIIGLTPNGRATVEALKLNRDTVVNLRRLLFLAGEHPPAEWPKR